MQLFCHSLLPRGVCSIVCQGGLGAATGSSGQLPGAGSPPAPPQPWLHRHPCLWGKVSAPHCLWGRDYLAPMPLSYQEGNKPSAGPGLQACDFAAAAAPLPLAEHTPAKAAIVLPCASLPVPWAGAACVCWTGWSTVGRGLRTLANQAVPPLAVSATLCWAGLRLQTQWPKRRMQAATGTSRGSPLLPAVQS